MKKVLFVATVDSHILAFHIPYLKYFKEQGYEVWVATNSSEKIPYCDKKYKIAVERSPFKVTNIKAIRELKKLIEQEKFEIIHCHTPMGSVVTRMASKKARKRYKTKVIYTAHGFHFYKGAKIINWLIYYPIEKYLSKFTDALITINEEDYSIAKNKFNANKTYLVNGVGISKEKFSVMLSHEEKQQLRKKLGIHPNDCVIVYVAELTRRKNQTMIINAIKEMKETSKKFKLLLVGDGILSEFYHNLISELQLEDAVKLLGFRKDIPELMQIADIYISTSKQEGLPVNIMEAMISQIPIIVTNCRGNRDLIQDEKNGYIIEIDDVKSLKEKILYIYNNYEEVKEKMKINSKLIQRYLIDNVMQDMISIYNELESK